MKITQNQLADLVTEELHLMVERGELDEGFLDRLKAGAGEVGTKVKGSWDASKQRAKAAKTGLKAKAVSRLGGDATSLQTQAGEEAELAAATKTGVASKVAAGKARSLLGGKVKKFNRLYLDLKNDTEKLGLDDPQLTQAIKAIDMGIKRIAAMLAKI